MRLLILLAALSLAVAVPLSAAGTRPSLLVFSRYESCPSDGGTSTPPACVDALYTVRADGTGLARLTPVLDGVEDPAWSPDGSKIAYARDARGIWIMNANGSGKRRLCDYEVCGRAPAWSPDGLRIAFGQDGVQILNEDGTQHATVPGTKQFQVTALDWSPDGKRLAFEACFKDIYVIKLDGSGRRLLVRDGESPRWSPDGRTILFTKNDGKAIYVVDARGGRPRLIRKTSSVFGADWSADGTRIAYFADKLHIFHLADQRDQLIRLNPPICAHSLCSEVRWERLNSPGALRLAE